MKFKKGIIIICLLICLFSIASVGASDVNDTVVASDDLIDIKNQDDISITEENTLSTSVGTFTDLANEINNADIELNLTRDYICNNDEIKNYKKGIKINKLIIINGDNHTLNANGLSRMFDVNANNVILKDINFINANLKPATDSLGGGCILLQGSNNLIENCNFNNNAAGSGSAIRISGSNNTIKNCDFNSNTAGSSGGALSVSGSYNYILNCNFINNTAATYHGGAIFLSANYCIIFNSSFINNMANQYGGAIYIDKTHNHIYGSIFKDNYAKSYDGGQIKIVSGEHNTFDFNSFIGDFSESHNGIYIQYSNNNFNNNWWGTDKGPKDVHFNPIAPKTKVWIQSNLTIDDSNNTNMAVYTKLNVLSNGTILNSDDYAKLPIRNVDYELYGEGKLSNYHSDTISSINYNNKPGEYDIKITSKVDNQITELTRTITIDKWKTKITVDNYTINYGDDLVVDVFVDNSTVTGNISLIVNNLEYNEDIIDNKATFELPILDAEIFNFDAIYNGNSYYNKEIAHGVITVNKADAKITDIQAFDNVYGQDTIIYVETDKDGNLTVEARTTQKTVDVFANNLTSINLGILDKGLQIIKITLDAGNNYIKPINYTTITIIPKPNPFISADPVTVKYGQEASITVNLASDVPGNVWFTVNGAKNKAKITNGVATYTVSGLNYGLYNVDISYAGNYKYGAYSINTTLKVNKNPTPIVSVVAKNIAYGMDEVITVNLSQNVPGNVHVTVNSKAQIAKIINNVATTTFSGLNKGTYDVKVTYNGNVNYNAQTKTTSFNVVKSNPIIKVYPLSDSSYGENQNIIVDVNNKVPGNLNFNVNGVNYKVKISGTRVSLNLPNLNSNHYDVKVYYAGSANFNAQSFNTSFNVAKVDPIKSVSVNDIVYGSSEIISVKLSNNVPGNVHITVNGVTEKAKITKGVASLSVSNLNVGSYDVKVYYAGSANFNPQEINKNFTVSKANPITSILVNDIIKGETATITVKFEKGVSGYARIIVNDELYRIKIENHKVTLSVSGLESGLYPVDVIYAGSANFNAQTESICFNVNKLSPNLEITVTNSGSNVIIRTNLPNDATGNVKINIDGTIYDKKINYGVASVAISNLQTGNHSITAVYDGDDKYDSVTTSKTFTL